MAQLYPPIIEGTIAAAVDNGTKVILTVPFLMNKAVSLDEIQGFSLQIKSVGLENRIIEIISTTDYDKKTMTANFILTKRLYTIGNFYKAQMAYVDLAQGATGYYSTIAIFKYTSKPIIAIETQEDKGFIGKYTNNIDLQEKLYSYNFTLSNESGSYKETSGEILYNNKDKPEIVWKPKNVFVADNYSIKFETKSINGIENSIIKNIVFEEDIELEENNPIEFTILKNNSENGYIDLQCKFLDFNSYTYHLIKNKNEQGWTEISNFKFLFYEYDLEYFISDSDGYDYKTIQSQDNYNIDNKIDFEDDPFGPYIITKKRVVVSLKDLCVEQGQVYCYGVYYSSGNKVTKKFFQEITTNFEHSYLFDGERQLKIKYNPKISSFKTTQLEQKTNTIGGKFPFFYTNANVNYKEFPISGLLSYLSDEEGLFDPKYATINLTNRDKTQSESDDWNNNIGSTQLTSENIELERQFKMEVLDFLTSGKPMLFRSPTEGNYIVRLSNVSLSPEDTLGRMLHTFSATATECAEYNEENLRELKLAIKEV